MSELVRILQVSNECCAASRRNEVRLPTLDLCHRLAGRPPMAACVATRLPFPSCSMLSDTKWLSCTIQLQMAFVKALADCSAVPRGITGLRM